MYILNLHNVICQLCLNRVEKKDEVDKGINPCDIETHLPKCSFPELNINSTFPVTDTSYAIIFFYFFCTLS